MILLSIEIYAAKIKENLEETELKYDRRTEQLVFSWSFAGEPCDLHELITSIHLALNRAEFGKNKIEKPLDISR